MTAKLLSPWLPCKSPDDGSIARFSIDGKPIVKLYYDPRPQINASASSLVELLFWKSYYIWAEYLSYIEYFTLKGAKRDIDRRLKKAGYRFLSEDEYQKYQMLQ